MEQNAKIPIQNILNYRRTPMWIVAVILILMITLGISLISNPEARSAYTDQEKSSMSTTWAEALKTRDGKPRYEMMSVNMKEIFKEQQKLRSDVFNYNIGGSSPRVVDYEIMINADSADIFYHMTDSTQERYDKTETIYFGKENKKTVIIDAKEVPAQWERVNYFAPSAKEAMEVYTKALLESDYSTILSLTHSSEFDSNGQQIWDTIKISDVNVISSDVRNEKAYYELELNIEDGGNSAYETGIFPRWLWLIKGEQDWYAEGLMTSGKPDNNWWNINASDPLFGTNQWADGTYEFGRLLYLSPLSSSTFDYAESRMTGTKYTIGKDLFEIDYPDDEIYRISKPVYIKEYMNGDMIEAFEASTMSKLTVSEYKEKYRYHICTEKNEKTNFCLYVLDDELWLASYVDNTADGSEITMDVCRLK